MDAAATQAHVQREDFRPHAYEFVLTSAALCGLAATGGGDEEVMIGVFMSWAALHLMYAARYAYHYYMLEPESIDFNAKEPPTFRDFFYFNYNLGMTYQVLGHLGDHPGPAGDRAAALPAVVPLRGGDPGHRREPRGRRPGRLTSTPASSIARFGR